MRILIIFFAAFLVLGSGSETTKSLPDESFRGIGSLGYRKYVPIGEGSYMRIPTYNIFVFFYHDSIFRIELDTLGNSTCYLMNYSPQFKHIADSLLKNLDHPDTHIPLKAYRGSCAPDMMYLGSKNGKTVFSGLGMSYRDIAFLLGRHTKRKKLPTSRQPALFQAKIHEFESHYLRHYFSEDYYYKEFRIEHRTPFPH